MRNYVRGIYGVFREENTNLGIQLDLRIWRRSLEEFDNVVTELKADVAAAGPPWTGTLLSKGYAWWTFSGPQGDDSIHDLLEVWFHGTSQSSTAFSDLMDDNLVKESPRKEGYNSISEE